MAEKEFPGEVAVMWDPEQIDSMIAAKTPGDFVLNVGDKARVARYRLIEVQVVEVVLNTE